MKKKVVLVYFVVLVFTLIVSKVKDEIYDMLCLRNKDDYVDTKSLVWNIYDYLPAHQSCHDRTVRGFAQRRNRWCYAFSDGDPLLSGKVYAAETESNSDYHKPNVIIIIADDLGYADIGIHGCKDIPTPNIDSLAQNGVRFTNGYVTCSVCSPSRAGILTGKYQQRFGHEFNANCDLSLKEVTLANLLKSGGYKTAVFGKWHLGKDKQFNPLNRGFDEYFGFLGGAHTYFNLRANLKEPIFKGWEPVDEKEYLTDAITRETVAFIEKHNKEPFFIYLTYNAVHTPMEAPEKYLSQFPNITDTKRKTYAAMLTAMDDGIGKVLKKLFEYKIEEDTLIFFVSDNGGPVMEDSSKNASCNDPLRAGKFTLYEGGIRVPFIVQWKRKLPSGKIYDYPVISLNIFPTVMAAAKLDIPKEISIDGVNLIPYLTDEIKTPPNDILYWRFGKKHALRKGNWKLVKESDEIEFELYDLSKDISETTNLAQEKPELVDKLTKILNKWESTLVEPKKKPKVQK